ETLILWSTIVGAPDSIVSPARRCAHGLRRVGVPLVGPAPERRRRGRRPATVGALLPPPGRPGPGQAPGPAPPRCRRGGRGPDRLGQFRPRRGGRPLPPPGRPPRSVAAAGHPHRTQGLQPGPRRTPPEARRRGRAGRGGAAPP